jgi:hypothetical protein
METDRPETEKDTWSDGEDGKCQAEGGLGRRPMLETGDWRLETGGRKDMVVTQN